MLRNRRDRRTNTRSPVGHLQTDTKSRQIIDLAPHQKALVVGPAGFEPATNGLRVRCSTS
jgi:hypothetical protein